MVLAILVSLACILAGYKAIGKGLIFGTLFSIINFILMGETLSAKLGNASRKTFIMALGSIVLRYFLLAVPLVVALKSENINFFAAAIGIFSVQLTILSDHLILLLFSSRKKKIRNTV